ncbi:MULTISPECIES: DUF6518 family protein [unclassified Curtobacterium]|uniref:DUF6518 family protein n=1 Tax=unclassified Curtobacterium TaxID=257496 RepID=UPI0039B06B77
MRRTHRAAPQIRIDLARPVQFLASGFAAGVVGGAVTFWAQGVLPQWLSLWANSPAPWALFAVVAGALAPRLWCALVGGVLAEWGLVFGYYELSDTHTEWWNRFDTVWLGAGLVAGIVCGAVGWWCRSERRWARTVAISLLPAFAFGTGLEYALRTDEHYEGRNVPDGISVMVVALAVGVLLRGTRAERALRVGLTIVLGLAAWAASVWLIGPLLEAAFSAR